ncbi:MAG: hypothetical protein UW09_C0003G0039 [candidate division TM6 bacterium GW2011_GWF2_43_87]|nr:MAG: hypothetical protein UW09_C0003G0039 [candidate division TM6 bacterium GW2011_GWF2_43_87]
MQPTVQSPATPPLPSYYFDRLVRNLFSAIRNNDVEKTVSILKNQPANVVKCLLESKEKNSKNSPLHAAIYCSEAMTTLLLKYGAPTTATDICGDTPLQCCIQHYLMNTIPLPLNIIKLFLDKDPSAISSSNNEGDTLLHSVCKSYNPNQTAAIELLLSYGALVTTPSKSYNRYTPFHLLIRACNTETKESLNMITKFLTIAPNLITTRDEIGSTPLHQAAANGLLETVKLFIQKGAKIDEPDYQGLTPLHEASRNGCLEIVTLLVQKGAKIDASTHQNLNNHSGNTPLHLASENGRLETIIFLIEHGAQVDERTAENQTSLHLAINSNNLETVLLLIKNGANVNAKDNNGVTPIHIATEKINLGIVMNLIAQGAKIDEPTTKNITPLLQAAQRTLRIFQNEKYLNENMTKIIQTLIDHGATTICKTVKHLNTALHLLVQSNNLDAIKILAKKKVLNNVQNLDGETPLHIIASKLANNAHSIEIAPQIIQILIDNGATINLQNKKKFTPLQCAVRSNGRRPAFTLIENGATIEFIINKTLNKPYKRNLPIVLSAFFKTLLKPEKSATDCALEKSPKWLEDDNALAQAYHSNKKITAETNLLMSTKNSLLRKLTFCLFFTAEEIYKLKISLDPKNPFKKLLTLTTEEYKLYMELFNSDPKEKRIRTLLGLLTTSKDVKILIQRLKKETVNSTPFDATKKVGSTKHDICIKFTPQDAWFIEKK